MELLWCLAGLDRRVVQTFAAMAVAIEPAVHIRSVDLDVTVIGKLVPYVLVCDVDGSDVDPLELLRRLRFVLPDCTIAVYSGQTSRHWAAACHLAGVTCMLSKASGLSELERGLRTALEVGCYSDPRFGAVAVS